MTNKRTLNHKINIRIVAVADQEEICLDSEEIPFFVEEQLKDLLHEISGLQVKDITVRIIR